MPSISELATYPGLADRCPAELPGREHRQVGVDDGDATVVRAHQHAAGARHARPGDIDPVQLAVARLSTPAGRGPAAILLTDGVSIAELASYLGHHDPAFTLLVRGVLASA